MSIVPSILLLNINSNEKHHLNASEYVIGRGWLNVSLEYKQYLNGISSLISVHFCKRLIILHIFLQCNDKRISRNHGVLKIISTNTVAVLSVRTGQSTNFFSQIWFHLFWFFCLFCRHIKIQCFFERRMTLE